MHQASSEFWNSRHPQSSPSNSCPGLWMKCYKKNPCKIRNVAYEWPFLCQHVQEGFMGLLRAVVGRLTWPQWQGSNGNRNMLKNQFCFFFIWHSLTFIWDVQNGTSIKKSVSFKNWSYTENILLNWCYKFFFQKIHADFGRWKSTLKSQFLTINLKVSVSQIKKLYWRNTSSWPLS